MNPGMKIKLRRIEKGFKAKDMAESLGISREYLRLIENGTARNVSDSIKITMASILESSVTELFFSENN